VTSSYNNDVLVDGARSAIAAATMKLRIGEIKSDRSRLGRTDCQAQRSAERPAETGLGMGIGQRMAAILPTRALSEACAVNSINAPGMWQGDTAFMPRRVLRNPGINQQGVLVMSIRNSTLIKGRTFLGAPRAFAIWRRPTGGGNSGNRFTVE